MQVLFKEISALQAQVYFCLLWTTALNLQYILYLQHPIKSGQCYCSRVSEAGEQERSSLAWFKVAQQRRGGWRNWRRLCQSDLVTTHTTRRSVLSPLLPLRDSTPAKYKEHLIVQGWSCYFHLDTAWCSLFPSQHWLPATTNLGLQFCFSHC